LHCQFYPIYPMIYYHSLWHIDASGLSKKAWIANPDPLHWFPWTRFTLVPVLNYFVPGFCIRIDSIRIRIHNRTLEYIQYFFCQVFKIKMYW
jgi:hypothetical protein